MMEYVIYVFVLTVISCVGFVIFKIYIRPRYPAGVTCWFCKEKTTVPYNDINSFTCPACEQYNGFDKSGDYNKPIPAMYDELSNAPTSCQQGEFVGGKSSLCEACSQNQRLIVTQMAHFVPYNEDNFSWEAKLYQQHLDKVYPLCGECQSAVREELVTQDELIACRYSNHQIHDDSYCSQSHEDELTDQSMTILTNTDTSRLVTIGRVLHLVPLLCAASLLLRTLDLSQIPGLQSWSNELHPILTELDRQGFTMTLVGMFFAVAVKFYLGKYRLRVVDVVSLPVWLLVLVVQTDVIPAPLVSHWAELACHVTNIVLCLLCVCVSRSRWDRPCMRTERSTTLIQRYAPAAIASVAAQQEWTEEGEYTDDEEEDLVDPPDVGSLTDRLSGLSSWINRQHKNLGVFQSNPLSSTSSSSVTQSDARSGGTFLFSQSEARSNGTFSFSQSEARSDGTFSFSQSMGRSSRTLPSSQSDVRPSETLSTSSKSNSRSGGTTPVRRRPLISPPSFVYKSTQAKHRFARGPANFGLFSPSTPPTTSVICGYSLFTYRQQPLIPPDKLAVQPKQSFGSSPYPAAPSQCKLESYERISLRSLSVEREIENTASYIVETQTKVMTETETVEEEMVIEELVDRFLDLPTLTHKTTNLRRSDSGFFSMVSDTDSPAPLFTSIPTSQPDYDTSTISEPRQLIRRARFVYQSPHIVSDP